MSAKVAVKSNVIKPLNPSDFNEEQIVFGNVITNTEIGNKYCHIPKGVIKERMRYMKQLNDQVMKSYNTLKSEGKIKGD